MLYISTSKIHESTVGASFTVSFTVAPDETDYLTALHEKYAEMNMRGFTIKPSDSEKPNNCETCKFAYITCRYEVRGEPCRYEPKTEPQTCANGCKWLNQDGECTEPSGECHIEYRTEVDEPQTDYLKKLKALQEHLGIKREPTLSEMVEGEPQTDCAWKKGAE